MPQNLALISTKGYDKIIPYFPLWLFSKYFLPISQNNVQAELKIIGTNNQSR